MGKIFYKIISGGQTGVDRAALEAIIDDLAKANVITLVKAKK
jgi:predicted Rossmann fold nucleotide-binding protein DprA/Smf involved in DNA uptake